MKEQFHTKNLVSTVIISIILPLVAYFILKQFSLSDTVALGISTAFPVVYMIFTLIKSHTVNLISLVAITGFVISLLSFYLSDGNNLAFKLWHPILTATIGVILLASVAINHPLLALTGKASDYSPQQEHRIFMIMTGYMGLVFTAHATTVISLAFILSTTEFVVISKIVDFSAIAVLFGGMMIIRNFLKNKEKANGTV